MPTYKARISAVGTPFEYGNNYQKVDVNLQIILDDEVIPKSIKVPILSFPISMTKISLFRGHEPQNCLSSFAKLYNLMHLLKINSRDPHELNGKKVYLMIGNEGYALSDKSQEKWVICNHDIPTALGLGGLVSYEEASRAIDSFPF